ncbi:hypothetical protein ADL26_08180 [Thermoactinomyces vulgaris]|nr:hypothetical protein ADL26_08180 [Thermoactinomyces vulgaris]
MLGLGSMRKEDRFRWGRSPLRGAAVQGPSAGAHSAARRCGAGGVAEASEVLRVHSLEVKQEFVPSPSFCDERRAAPGARAGTALAQDGHRAEIGFRP